MNISHIVARQILDSRGNPTLEAEVHLKSGVFGRAAVPSGASTGAHEAHELRDGDEALGGLSVHKAIANVTGEIYENIKDIPVDDQFRLDEAMIELDGTPNKERLGANSILAVSMAAAHAAAKERGIKLYNHINDIAANPKMSIPLPMLNVLNGGRHAPGSADFQEYMIIPRKAKSYQEAIQTAAEVFHSLKSIITERGGSVAVGDEGGFTFGVESNTEMLDVLSEASETAGFRVGDDIGFALDVAASELFENGEYYLHSEARRLSGSEMIYYLSQIAETYPLLSIEDGLDQDDWEGWQELTGHLREVQLVGDDLLVTNIERLNMAIEKVAANAVLIKPNQVGSLTETIKTIQMARDNGWRTIVSHRSGETEDVTIAHLAVGIGAGQIKTGSLSRSERTAKHNELMRIEEADENLEFAQPF